MASRPTLAKVALTAGVSKTTASYVLNGQKKMSAETTRRVKEAARRLGYRLDASASGLSRGRSQTIGVLSGETVISLVTGSNSLFWLHINDAFVRRCSREGLVVAFAGDDRAQALIDSGIDALIILGVHNPQTFEGLRVPFGLPIMSLEPVPGHDNFLLSYDNDAIADLVLGHLVEQGATKLAWLAEVGSEAIFNQLVTAMTAWTANNNVDFTCYWYEQSPEGITASVNRILDDGVDGLFSMCGLPKQLTDGIEAYGKSVPEDLLLVMQSEGLIEQNMKTPLSNFSYLGTDFGETLADMCIDVVRDGTPPTKLDLNFALTVRESSLRKS